jgi:hypothetical protein
MNLDIAEPLQRVGSDAEGFVGLSKTAGGCWVLHYALTPSGRTCTSKCSTGAGFIQDARPGVAARERDTVDSVDFGGVDEGSTCLHCKHVTNLNAAATA